MTVYNSVQQATLSMVQWIKVAVAGTPTLCGMAE